MLHRLWKPWYLYQPTRLLRHALGRPTVPSVPGYVPIPTSWGGHVIADPTRTIGRSLVTIGVYELAVSEALARLISPGDTVVDAGTNVGYMTVLASVAAGPAGRVISFEPHPELFAIAERNVAAIRGQLDVAQTDLHQAAVGERSGTAQLQVPPDFSYNDGVSRIAPPGSSAGGSVTVAVESLDDALGDRSAAVLKMDVEGFEPQVLRGAARALADGRIRHVIFEEHDIANSDVARLLRAAGFRLFSLGWVLRGPKVQPVESGSLAKDYEPPNYIATLDPAELLARFQPRGWLVLSKRFTARRR